MKSDTWKILLVALVAGTLGLVAAFAVNGPGPLLRTEIGQRLLQTALSRSAPKPPPGTEVAQRGELVPILSLTGLNGRQIQLPSAYAGRPLLINFWASWCGPCVKEMPELQRFSVEQASNGVQVVGIALDDVDAVRDFLTRVQVTYPILLDSPGPADTGVRLGNPKGVLPYSVLISADGRLLKQRIGPFADGEVTSWAKP
ncbi:MAG: TlpA family protein disulfide reductase [Lysobacter sp.]|nr:TlpA family protein disulfide reductase [Lysobacter sp.]